MKGLVVEVSLLGQQMGALSWAQDGYGRFEYYPQFIQLGLEVSPLIMPLGGSKGRVYAFPENIGPCFGGLPGLIADALPDRYGTEQIDAYLSARGIPYMDITPLERLCYVGKRAMGALEFQPSERLAQLDESSRLDIADLVSVAQEVFKRKDSFQTLLEQEDKRIIDILRVGTSAGGAKPKAIIAYNEATGEVRSGQVKAPTDEYGYWILKFDGVGYQEHSQIHDDPQGIGQIEYAYYLMAKDCGIEMNECRLLQEGESYHFMTRRFDRTPQGDKIHMQTLAAMAHFDRDRRYAYENLFEVVRRLGLTYGEHEQAYRRMVFNVLSRNHDDHTKNHSFLMDRQGRWTLSPAYDLCYSYNPHGRFTKAHQMYINGKNIGHTAEDLLEVGRRAGIIRPNVILEQVREVVSAWGKYAQQAGVRDQFRREIEQNLLLL